MKFHPQTEQKNPNAVETFFCKELEKFKPKELSVEQMQFMLIIGSRTNEYAKEMVKEFTEVYWFFPAIEKRCNAMYSFKIDLRAQMLLCSWCQSIGDVVMYLTYLQYQCKKRNIKEVDFDRLALIFADGIFDREYMRECWEKQKVMRGDGYSDNLVDYPTAIQSILH